MARKKKFLIQGINEKLKYCEAGKVVLNEKLEDIFRLINLLFEDDRSENIHALRIALRRLRYVLEIFSVCYDRQIFNYLYKKLKFLQDLIGECRDLDVMGQKVEEIAKDTKSKIPKYFYKKIDEKRLVLRQIIKQELIKFISDKKVNGFLINKEVVK